MQKTIQSIFRAARGPLLAVAALASLQVVQAGQAAGNAEVIATGSGQTFVDNGLRNFSFAAVRLANGSVRGQMEVRNPDSTIRTHMAINCALVLEVPGVGELAVMSGVVTVSSDPALLGFTAVWAVMDTGEGAGAAPDEITQVNGFAPFPVPCACDLLVEDVLFPGFFAFVLSQLTPIAGGNVQVH